MFGALVLLLALFALEISASSCDPSLFKASQLHPADFNSYENYYGGGGIWEKQAPVDFDVTELQCGATASFLWKLEYNGAEEGVMRAVMFFSRFPNNDPSLTAGQQFGEMQGASFNLDDPANSPAFQPTVSVTVQQIEKPDASLEDGYYYDVKVFGLVGPSTSVLRFDVPIICNLDPSFADHVKLEAKIIKSINVDCVPESKLSEDGVAHDFGTLYAPVEPVPHTLMSTFRQGIRGGLNVTYSITDPDGTCPGSDLYVYASGDCTYARFCYNITNPFSTQISQFSVVDSRFTDSVTGDDFVVVAESEGVILAPGETVLYERVLSLPFGSGANSSEATARGTVTAQNEGVSGSDRINVVGSGDIVCECLEDGAPVSTFTFTCNEPGTVNVPCTRSAATQQLYRCIVEGESPTHNCFRQSLTQCRYRPSTNPINDVYLCSVEELDAFVPIPNDIVCPEELVV